MIGHTLDSHVTVKETPCVFVCKWVCVLWVTSESKEDLFRVFLQSGSSFSSLEPGGDDLSRAA